MSGRTVWRIAVLALSVSALVYAMIVRGRVQEVLRAIERAKESVLAVAICADIDPKRINGMVRVELLRAASSPLERRDVFELKDTGDGDCAVLTDVPFGTPERIVVFLDTRYGVSEIEVRYVPHDPITPIRIGPSYATQIVRGSGGVFRFFVYAPEPNEPMVTIAPVTSKPPLIPVGGAY